MGTIDATTSNVGGTIMINQIKKNHTVNMMTMKKRVDNELPWAYKNSNKKFNVNSSQRLSPLKKGKTSPLKDNRLHPLGSQSSKTIKEPIKWDRYVEAIFEF